MSNAINARIQGDEYQACFFWLQVCRLFAPHTKVKKVAYEADNVKSFDDVVVYYSEPQVDMNNNPVFTDYYQIKFHVTKNGAFTLNGLIDPAFINAESVSILQRLHNAQKVYAPNGTGSRFYLVAPWIIHPDDELSKIITCYDSEIRIDKLFDNRPATKMAKIRKALKGHLGINSDDELKKILMPLRIWENFFNSYRLLERLSTDLLYAGFEPIQNNSLINPYTDLIRKLFARGVKEFTKESIIEICQQEKLYTGVKTSCISSTPLGIRSFYRRAECMNDETTDMLCLLKYFDNRYILDNQLWNSKILPELQMFFSNSVKTGQLYSLYLDTHGSIAFAAGHFLDPKVGAEAYPVQKSTKGRQLWIPDNQIDNKNYTDWTIKDDLRDMDGTDIVLALSITHDICNWVEGYVKETEISAKYVIHNLLSDNISNLSIVDGSHAWILANKISGLIRKIKATERKAHIHIFAAAPNGFMFFLGQLSRSFGKCTIYEYDFDNRYDGSYFPAITLPFENNA